MNQSEKINHHKVVLKKFLDNKQTEGQIRVFHVDPNLVEDFVTACKEMETELKSHSFLPIVVVENDSYVAQNSLLFAAILMAESMAKKPGNGRNPQKIFNRFLLAAQKKLSTMNPAQMKSFALRYGLEQVNVTPFLEKGSASK